MEIIIQPDSQQASELAARITARTVREKPHAVLGFATGNTPLQLDPYLVRMHRESGLDFSDVTSFNLDEYVGIRRPTRRRSTATCGPTSSAASTCPGSGSTSPTA